MAGVTVNGGAAGTLTFNVSGSAATNFANALKGTFPAVSILSGGASESTIAGALNIVYSGGPSTNYTLATPDQYAYVSVGDPETITGSSAGDTLFGGADLTYTEAPGGHDNQIIFTDGNNTFDGAKSDYGDTVATGSGYDTVNTGGGPTTVYGGTGNAFIVLNDTTPGDIAVLQSTGYSTVEAHGVADTVSASVSGAIEGGSGSLVFAGGASSTEYFVNLYTGTGPTEVFGATNLNLYVYGAGSDLTLVAGAGNETLDGAGSSGFAFFGNTTSDTASTTVYGGSGSDYFFTGAGNEYLSAGSGDDTFNIASVAGSPTITIADFTSADSVNFESPIASQGASDGNYVVTLNDGTTVEFLGITSLPTHTTT